MASRNDVGTLWENYMIVERMKFNSARGGVINGYEFKFTKGGIRRTTREIFDRDIKGNTLELINKDNYSRFIGA